jgi:hypothetical protein
MRDAPALQQRVQQHRSLEQTSRDHCWLVTSHINPQRPSCDEFTPRRSVGRTDTRGRHQRDRRSTHSVTKHIQGVTGRSLKSQLSAYLG